MKNITEEGRTADRRFIKKLVTLKRHNKACIEKTAVIVVTLREIRFTKDAKGCVIDSV